MVESALFKKRLYAKLTENLDKNKQIFGSHLEQLSQNDAVLRNILSCTLVKFSISNLLKLTTKFIFYI